MTEAEKLFNDAFLRTIAGWGTVLSFRQIVEKGFHAAMQVYEAEVMQFLQHQVSRPDPIVDPSVLGGMADAVSKMITQTTAEQAKASVDAASLIFTHSILDGAAFDYCRVTAMLAPDKWLPFVRDRRVSLSDVQAATADALLKLHVDKYLEQLERESVRVKVRALYTICQPSVGWTSHTDDYAYDSEHVERLDRIRHTIIHGDGLGRPLPNAFEELQYLVHTANHCMALVHHRFGLKINPMYAREFYASRSTTPLA